MNAQHSAAIMLLIAALVVGPFSAGASLTHAAAAGAPLSGSVTIDDSGSYSNDSQAADDSSHMTCKETIDVHQDGSATETIDYSYHDIDQQTNNGYETKRTVDIAGSGTVQYTPQLNITIDSNGTYYLRFGTADPGIALKETVTFEQTGQPTRTIHTTATVDCQYNPNLLQGKLSGGPVLKIDVSEDGYWNTDEDHNDYGPCTIIVNVDDPSLGGSGQGQGHGHGHGQQPQPTPQPDSQPQLTPQPDPQPHPCCQPKPQPDPQPQFTPQPCGSPVAPSYDGSIGTGDAASVPMGVARTGASHQSAPQSIGPWMGTITNKEAINFTARATPSGQCGGSTLQLTFQGTCSEVLTFHPSLSPTLDVMGYADINVTATDPKTGQRATIHIEQIRSNEPPDRDANVPSSTGFYPDPLLLDEASQGGSHMLHWNAHPYKVITTIDGKFAGSPQWDCVGNPAKKDAKGNAVVSYYMVPEQAYEQARRTRHLTGGYRNAWLKPTNFDFKYFEELLRDLFDLPGYTITPSKPIIGTSTWHVNITL